MVHIRRFVILSLFLYAVLVQAVKRQECYQVATTYEPLNIDKLKVSFEPQTLDLIMKLRKSSVDSLCRFSYQSVLRMIRKEINTDGVTPEEMMDIDENDLYEDGGFTFLRQGKYDYTVSSPEFQNCIKTADIMSILPSAGSCYVEDWPLLLPNVIQNPLAVLDFYKVADLKKLNEPLKDAGFAVKDIMPCRCDCLNGIVRIWLLLVSYFIDKKYQYSENDNLCKNLSNIGNCLTCEGTSFEDSKNPKKSTNNSEASRSDFKTKQNEKSASSKNKIDKLTFAVFCLFLAFLYFSTNF